MTPRAPSLRKLAVLALVGLWLAACRAGGKETPEPSASRSTVVVATNRDIPADGETPAIVTVSVRDAAGEAIAGVPVTAELTGSDHSIEPTEIESDSVGMARLSVTSTRAEVKTLRLRAGRAGGVSLEGAWQLRFVATAPSPPHCSVIAPSGLYAPADGTVPTPILVVVRDRFLNPIADVEVELAASGEGHVLTQPTAATDARGTALGAIASPGIATKTVMARVRTLPVVTDIEQRVEIRFVDRPIVSGVAVFADVDADGVCSDRDTLLVPLAEAVTLGSPATSGNILSLAAAGDSLGEGAREALAPTSDGVFVQLGKHPRLRARGGFSPLLRARNSPSGIDLSPALPRNALVSAVNGLGATSRTFVDVYPDVVRAITRWTAAAVCLASGDLDRDGDQDLLFASVDGTIAWSRNDRRAGFSSAMAVARIADRPVAIAIADVDFDGQLDFVISSAATGVTLHRAESGLTFAAAEKLIGGSGSALAIVDLDADGKLEVVVCAGDGVVWRASADASSSPRPLFNLGVVPHAVASGDFDNDGDVDLAFASPVGIFVLDNLGGMGTFRLGATLSMAGIAAVTRADLDLDGDLDLAVAGSHGARVLWNVRPGLFVDGGLTLGTEPATALLVIDLDGDGDCDLVTAAADGGVWLNERPGFARVRSALVVTSAHTLTANDFDRDGDVDLVSASSTAAPVRWLGSLTAVRGDLELGATPSVASAALAVACRVADLDRDGDLDVVVAHARGGARVWLNDGTGGLTDSGQAFGVFDNMLALALGDVDGDGDIDFITGNTVGQPERLYLNTGRAQFVETPQAIGTGSTTALALADVDRDGDLDLVVGNSAIGSVGNRVFLNDGRGGFAGSGQIVGVTDTRAMVVTDIDDDADVDLVIGATDGTLSFWINAGRGNFSDSGQRIPTGRLASIAAGDVDVDGDCDLVIGIDSAEPDRVLHNNGRGVFADSGERLGAQPTTGTELLDIDGDGDLDLVTTTFGGGPRLFLNDGRGRFRDFTLAAEVARVLCAADLDRDGDLDLVLVGNDGRLRVVLNR